MRKLLLVTVMLLVACFEGTIAIAQGQPEPTLALLRSGARTLVNRPDRQQLLADTRSRASLRLHDAILRARRSGLIVGRGDGAV